MLSYEPEVLLNGWKFEAPLGMDTGVWHHEMKANPTGYLWSSINAL